MKILYFYSNFTKFIPGGPIDNKSVLVQLMAWRQTGDAYMLCGISVVVEGGGGGGGGG